MDSLFLFFPQRGMGNCFFSTATATLPTSGPAPVVGPAVPVVTTVASGAVIVILPSFSPTPSLIDEEDDPR